MTTPRVLNLDGGPAAPTGATLEGILQRVVSTPLHGGRSERPCLAEVNDNPRLCIDTGDPLGRAVAIVGERRAHPTRGSSNRLVLCGGALHVQCWCAADLQCVRTVGKEAGRLARQPKGNEGVIDHRDPLGRPVWITDGAHPRDGQLRAVAFRQLHEADRGIVHTHQVRRRPSEQRGEGECARQVVQELWVAATRSVIGVRVERRDTVSVVVGVCRVVVIRRRTRGHAGHATARRDVRILGLLRSAVQPGERVRRCGELDVVEHLRPV